MLPGGCLGVEFLTQGTYDWARVGTYIGSGFLFCRPVASVICLLVKPSSASRVRTLSAYFRERYGERVHKIAIDYGFTCPNRDGALGVGGCAFCDSQGAAAAYSEGDMDLGDYVRRMINRFEKRFKAKHFIAYFQSYAGTYASPDVLRRAYDQALCDERVIGLSVATRSDCLSDGALDVLADYVKRLREVRVEFGLQTTNKVTLAAMNCGHTPEDFVDATRRAHDRGLRVCAHVIFGLPGDRPEDVYACADLINALGVEGVKIHNLYLTPDSRLGREFSSQPFPMMSREEYLHCACEMLARLGPAVVIERVVGDAPDDRRLAPDWTIPKQYQWQIINEAMELRGLVQGGQAVFDSERVAPADSYPDP